MDPRTIVLVCGILLALFLGNEYRVAINERRADYDKIGYAMGMTFPLSQMDELTRNAKYQTTEEIAQYADAVTRFHARGPDFGHQCKYMHKQIDEHSSINLTGLGNAAYFAVHAKVDQDICRAVFERVRNMPIDNYAM